MDLQSQMKSLPQGAMEREGRTKLGQDEKLRSDKQKGKKEQIWDALDAGMKRQARSYECKMKGITSMRHGERKIGERRKLQGKATGARRNAEPD
jgi:hypothetical protein